MMIASDFDRGHQLREGSRVHLQDPSLAKKSQTRFDPLDDPEGAVGALCCCLTPARVSSEANEEDCDATGPMQ